MVPRVLVYNHLDEPLFELDPTKLIGLTTVEKVNGEHSMTITTMQELSKGQRVFYMDVDGKVREFVVLGDTASHADGGAHTYYCVWSLQHDLSAAYIKDRRLGNVDNQRPIADALGVVTSTTRWEVGTSDVQTLSSGWFYYTSCWDALSRVVEQWVGEVDTTIVLGSEIRRFLDFHSKLGDQEPRRRFEYGFDMTSVKRTVLDDLFVCRIVPRGKGEQVSDDPEAYGRRITIESVNPTGEVWIQDDAAAELVKLPNGDGFDYPTSIVVYESIEEPQELYDRAMEDLESYTRPKISYEADVLSLTGTGAPVSLGDSVQVVDRTFGKNGLRLSARVLGITRDLLEPANDKLVIGNFQYMFSDTVKELVSGLSAAKEQIIDTDGKADAAISDASAASQAALDAQAVANAVSQHFWTDGNGAHITDVTKEEWSSPLSPSYQSGFNSLWNSLGMLFRNAMKNLVSITSSAVAFFDGSGNGADNIVASFGSDGAVVGREGEAHTTISPTETVFYGADGNEAAHISMSSPGAMTARASYSLTTVLTNVISETISGIEPLHDFSLGNMVLRVYLDGVLAGTYNISSYSEPQTECNFDDVAMTCQVTRDGDAWSAALTAKNYIVDLENNPNRVATFSFEWLYTGSAPMFNFGGAAMSGAYAFAAGNGNQVSAENSAAIGIGLIASAREQVVVGKYNKPSQWARFIVGNGNDEDSRSNALMVSELGVLETNGYYQNGGAVGLGADARQGWRTALGLDGLFHFETVSSASQSIASGSVVEFTANIPAISGMTCRGATQVWTSGTGTTIVGAPWRTSGNSKIHAKARGNVASNISVSWLLFYTADAFTTVD